MPVHHAFIDESGRGADYYVCAAVSVAEDVQQARQLARSFLLPRQRRWHFAEERPQRRRQILTAVVRSRLVTVFVAHGKGDSEPVRAACLTQLTTALIDHRTQRVVIESRAQRDDRDRATLARALKGAVDPFGYVHHTPVEDPGLWLADAAAWSYSAGGSWRQTLEPALRAEFNLGSPGNR